MKGVPCRFSNGTMYKMPVRTVKTSYDSYSHTMIVYDYGNKLVFQGYENLCGTPRLQPDRERYVLTVKKGVHLYKIDKTNPRRSIYQYSPLNMQHFEGVMRCKTNVSEKHCQAHYLWLSKFVYTWLKRNGVSMPRMKFPAFSVKKYGVTRECYYLWRIMQYACYPMVRDMYVHENFPLVGGVDTALSPYLRKHRSIRKLTQSIFGNCTAYTMNIVKLSLDGDMHMNHVLTMAIILRGLIPVDYWPRIAESLDKAQFYRMHDFNYIKVARAFFKQYKQERILALITSKHSFTKWNGTVSQKQSISFLYDILRNWHEYRDKIIIPKDMSNLKDIHDYVSIEYRKMQTANHEIKLPPTINELQGKMIHNMSILLPKQTHDLIEWGQTMNNCIGGYGNSVLQGKTLCMALLKNNEMVYNLEVRDGRVVQFYGKRNNSPDPRDEEIVRSYLKEQKVIA